MDLINSPPPRPYPFTTFPSPPRENLSLVTALGDRAAQGRAFGNLGNTHYLLGNFRDAVIAHEQVPCQALRPPPSPSCPALCEGGSSLVTAVSNQCFPFQRLLIAKEFGDKAAERRAYSNLGNAYIFLGEFEMASEYYKLV